MTSAMAVRPPLLERPTYAFPEVDDLLRLSPGTARRWIDGYERHGRAYDPVVRIEPTGDEIATWGEFVEARLLAEYRGAGVSMQRLRPAVMRLREEYGPFPLARAEPLLDVEGRELVRTIQDEVGLDAPLQLVVVRNEQLILASGTRRFVETVEYGENGDGRIVERLHPEADLKEVVFDPLRRSGRPVVRAVPTDVIAEQIRAGDSIAMVADAYELEASQVEAAIRFELLRTGRRAA
jgi:uncharacterized protein (DUF433 family)